MESADGMRECNLIHRRYGDHRPDDQYSTASQNDSVCSYTPDPILCNVLVEAIGTVSGACASLESQSSDQREMQTNHSLPDLFALPAHGKDDLGTAGDLIWRYPHQAGIMSHLLV
jgi:hypothetical protein